MITIALIGGDGAGKSTIAKKLISESDLPMKYIYMGNNIESSNYALPWSRLMLRRKLRKIKKQAERKGIQDKTFLTTHHISHRQKKSGVAQTLVRSLNRFTEIAYRNVISWLLRMRGYNVIYDRHFLFDTFVQHDNKPKTPQKKIEALYYKALKNFFPIPHLIIFLDASPEVMVARKQEATIEYLQARRDYWLALGQTFDNFVRVDADQGINEVFSDVLAILREFSAEKGFKIAAG